MRKRERLWRLRPAGVVATALMLVLALVAGRADEATARCADAAFCEPATAVQVRRELCPTYCAGGSAIDHNSVCFPNDAACP